MAVKRSIVERLTSQLQDKGMAAGKAHGVAVATLQQAGVLVPGTETLTAHGARQQALGAKGRAIERAAAASEGRHSPTEYVYSSKTNRATLKGR